MNRPLKFRLRFGNNTVGFMQFMNQGENANLNWMYSVYGKTWEFSHEFAYTEVSQFTGLLDKNGKEIYEGDIVKRFSGQTYRVDWVCAGFWFVNPNLDDVEPQPNEVEHYEVIGNIYENPDLINPSLQK